jgi:hypothetical protein
MSGWFTTQIVHTGRLPLFSFFVAFLVSFAFIRVSVRMIRAQVRWWPGNVSSGGTHVHHMVFGVVFMVAAGVAGFAAPAHSQGWRAGYAALFGVGTALVLDEFALILNLRDVYWTSKGRVSIDAVFLAAGLTALLLFGITPAGVSDVANFRQRPATGEALAGLTASLVVLFAVAAITLLKGKIWTVLLGVFLPFLFLVGALRLARPHSPWARWRYQGKPEKLARASRREERFRKPVIDARTRVEDLVAGYHGRPARRAGSTPAKRDAELRAGPAPGIAAEGALLSRLWSSPAEPSPRRGPDGGAAESHISGACAVITAGAPGPAAAVRSPAASADRTRPALTTFGRSRADAITAVTARRCRRGWRGAVTAIRCLSEGRPEWPRASYPRQYCDKTKNGLVV